MTFTALPPIQARNLQGVLAAVDMLRKALSVRITEVAWRVNRALLKDGTEAMTGTLVAPAIEISGAITYRATSKDLAEEQDTEEKQRQAHGARMASLNVYKVTEFR